MGVHATRIQDLPLLSRPRDLGRQSRRVLCKRKEQRKESPVYQEGV
jgi:hypothetical protein